MTTEINPTQVFSAAQEKNKMPFDHDPLSASTQRGPLHSSMSGGRKQCSSQPPSADQAALRSCIYIALRCLRCGAVRQAITEVPAQDVVACPECGLECSFVLLGPGLTSRSLPFHQVHSIELMRWDQPSETETDSS
jgi:DNA-directed RNA polymerase subunit RPC12/RpoP